MSYGYERRNAAERFRRVTVGNAAVAEVFGEDFNEQEYAETLAFMTRAERRRYEKLLRHASDIIDGKLREPLSFADFIKKISGERFIFYEYAARTVAVLQRVADGELKRVIIMAPPRHGKSEPVSRLFPAYFLYRHPSKWVGLTSYGAELSHTFSRAARSNYADGVGLVSKEASAVIQWETAEGGGLWSAGIGGSILGKGFSLGVIDDPYKNAEEAASPTIRERYRDWYNSTFYTRQEPDAAIVVVMQRWAEDDLVGWLLEQEYAAAKEEKERGEWGEEAPDEHDESFAERWHIVNFEAIKRDEREVELEQAARGLPRWPSTCTVEPDWRQPGEALAPERYSAKRLRAIARRIGPYFFNALYQQNPRPKAGAMFGLDSLKVVEDYDREGAVYVRWWDFAGSEKKQSDYTVGALVAKTRHGAYVIVDIVRGQWAQEKRDPIIRSTAVDDRQRYGVALKKEWFEIEGGSAGLDQEKAIRRLLEGLPVDAEHSTGPKTARAMGLASSAAGGNVYMLRAEWNATVRREVLDFPNGEHDDIVDAIAGAYNKLANRALFAPLPPSVSSRG